MFNKNKRFFIISIIFVTLAVLLNAFLIYQSCLPGDESGMWSQPVTDVIESGINTVSPGTINESNIEKFTLFVRKSIGHFALFGLNGILTTLAIYFSCCDTTFYKHYKAILISLSIGLFVAALTEIIQGFIPSRAGAAIDSAVDFVGFILGLGITYLIILLILRNKRKKAKN